MSRLTALIVLLASAACAQVPDTPAGRQFSAWLKSFNTGDRATMLEFLTQQDLPKLIDASLSIYGNSGGYDVKKVEESTETRIIMLVQERGPAKVFQRIIVGVAGAPPHKMTTILIQPSAPSPELKLTEQQAEAARKQAPFLQFSAYLDAFNAGDRERLGNYLKANYPQGNVDREASFRGRTGGFDLRALEQASDTSLTGLVQERDSDQFARFTVVVEPEEPHRIKRLMIAAIPRPAEFPVARRSETELVAALRSKIEKDGAADRFSGAVLVVKRGKVLFNGAYGLADREKRIANTLDTRFRIGSMNKMFTAVAVLQLVQAGKIKLTDPLGTYIKDYPNEDIAAKVTIHHLLTHTGGTGDIFGPEYNARRLDLKTLNDYIALYGKRAPAFAPGSSWAYSNYGMLLLGVVIERVSGKTYYDYVAEHIYGPAGMTRTGSEPESEEVAGRSIGYMRAPGASGLRPNTDTLPWRGTAAGGGYSTVSDLMKFADALLTHKLLDAKHTDLLISGKVDSGAGRKYAYGFEDARKDGAGSVGHGGGAPGMNGDLRIYPRSGYVVAVLSNLDPPAAQQISTFIDLRIPQ
jgi:CubicO group peptidase (beta-lactamase class C family)